MTLDLSKIDLKSFDQGDDNSLNSNMTEAVKVDPKNQARINDLSRRSGVPEFAVQDDPDEVEHNLKLSQIDIEGFKQRAPRSSKFLEQNFNHAVLAQEDVASGVMESFESSLNPVIQEEPGFVDNSLRAAGERSLDLFGSLTKFASQAGDALEESFGMGGFVFENSFIPRYVDAEELARLSQEGLPDLLDEAGEALEEVELGYESRNNWETVKETFRDQGISFDAVANTFLFGVETTVQSIPDMAAAVVALPAYISARSQEIGESRAQNKGLEGATFTETVEAVPYAVAASLLERILPQSVVKRMGDTEVAEIGIGILNRATQKLKKTAVATGTGALTEAATEAVQEGVIEYVGERYGTNAELILSEAFDRGLGGAVGGGVGGGVIAGAAEVAAPSRVKSTEIVVAEAERQIVSASDQKTIDQLNIDSERSKLKEHDLETFKQSIREMDGDNDTHVYIDGVQTALYLQSKTRDEIEADPALKRLDDALSDARQTGTDVAIAVEDFTGDIASTDHFSELREHMTLNEEAVSPFRQEQHQEETGNFVRNLMDEADQNVSQYVQAQEIFTSVRDQLIDSGAVNAQNASVMAQVVPAWATAKAQRTGSTVEQVYADAGLTIEGPQSGERARLEGNQVLGQARQSGYAGDNVNEANEWQSAVDKGLDMSQEGRMQRARDMGFDTETTYYHGSSVGGYNSTSDIVAFDKDKIGDKFSQDSEGFFFINTKGQASDYATSNGVGDTVAGGAVYPVHLNTDNPLILDEKIRETMGVQPPSNDGVVAYWDINHPWILEEVADGQHDSVVLVDEDIDVDGGPERMVVVFEPEQIRSVNAAFDPDQADSPVLLAQSSDQEPRGYYDPSNSIIRLTESTDLSTFLHEFAHFMYEMELNEGSDTAKSINNWYSRNGEEVLKEAIADTDLAISQEQLNDFLERKSTGDKDIDEALRRATHEQFARGFETYLMEGKAPSVELRNAFRTFARWLTRIYQSVKGNLNVNLDDEMRQVFDRLIATDDQIAAAEARNRIEPFFTDAAMAGMTDEEFSAYKKRQQKVKDIQTETLRDKIIGQFTRQTKKWWKAERQDLIDEELDRLSGTKTYSTITKLKMESGEVKLDHATVKEIMGEQRVDSRGVKSVHIPSAFLGMTVKGGQGIHPDEAAAFFGYRTGSEMMTEIAEAPAIKEVALANAEERMLDIHGDILNDGTIERQADDAVRDEERGKLILSELQAVVRGTNQRVIERQTLKDIAAEKIGLLSFRKIHPGKYRKAEVAAAQEAARMLAEGNREGAAQAKQRQAVNYYMAIEAANAKNEVTKIVDRMARYNKKKVREEIQKADNGYWEQITKILERFEFRKSATLSQVDAANQSLESWVKERIETDGDGLVLHTAALNEHYTTHWKNVAFSDLQGINDSLKNIEHVARYANKMTLMDEQQSYQKLRDSWVDHIEQQEAKHTRKDTASRLEDVRKEGFGDVVKRWNSQLTKVPFLASWLDGGERVGMSHQILMQRLTEALDEKMKLFDEVAVPILSLLESRTKEDVKRHSRKIYIPEIDGHLTGDQVVAVALNVGNASNLRKLLLGEGWANPDNDAEISFDNPKLQAILQHMKTSDWQMVQQVWDQMELLYPKLEEVHRRTTGLTPPKIEATPIVIKVEGVELSLKGGYYPVKYSTARSHRAEKNAEKQQEEIESMFSNGSSIQASVNAGATNTRTGIYDSINLNPSGIPEHFNETIHYITHHDAVRQINKLIQDPKVANAITGVMGESEYKQLKPWLNDVAKDGRGAPIKSAVDEIFQRLRFGVTLGAMGFKASTGIMQVFGLLTTAAEIGPGKTAKAIVSTVGRSHYLRAVRKTLGSTDDIQSNWNFASEKSKVLNHRAKTMDRELRNAMDRLTGKKGKLAAVQETSMKHIALIQTYIVDLPTWIAAYDSKLAETGDETKAIQYGDWAVENLQGSGATKDMATLMRSQTKFQSTVTMFMTFFSSLGNLSRDLARGAKSGQYSPTTVAAKTMFLFTLPVFLEMLMRGEFEEPEGEDDRMQQWMIKTALYPITPIPVFRDLASGVVGDYGYNMTPVAGVLERGIQGLKQTDRLFTDEEMTDSAFKNVTKLAGAVVGVPGVNQGWASWEHITEVLEKGEDAAVRELLFGPKR